ncbi:TolC family protein [Neolewinella lacunae]|uniref:TolC family protein n=1 Tax=Neolewinella lacunae TaxID=1517758 RepID=A0A923PQV9_9BACT|nr:TolC family protein [Neolewinella lacunae]MBC6995092.1 TolC family protein [Neolewinella lacunae]MDN3634042.1 TolC family protein [Neolewinella lacunae]
MRTIKDQAFYGTILLMAFTLLLSLLLSTCVRAQELSLTQAYALLESNYPNLRNAGLNDQILRADLDLLDLERKPELYLKGAASLQSETTSFGEASNLPISLDLPLYNARAYGEVNHTLYDGGRLAARKSIKAAEGQLSNQQLEVEKFSLRKRINQLFLGVLLSRERVALYETTLADIAARKAAIKSGVELGVVLESELLQLSVREVEITADRDDINGNILRLLANLATLTGQPLPAEVKLRLPTLPYPLSIPEVDRPELQLFQRQRAAILANEALIEADTKPMVSAFIQAGVGVPNPVNLFDTEISPYALGGVNFQWKFKDWGKADQQRQLLQLRSALVDRQRETFLFNLNAENEAYLADVRRLQQRLLNDRKIVELQANILTQLAAQLDNGVITATDYLNQVNVELRARQTLRVDEMQLIELQLNFLNERGGF